MLDFSDFCKEIEHFISVVVICECDMFSFISVIEVSLILKIPSLFISSVCFLGFSDFCNETADMI